MSDYQTRALIEAKTAAARAEGFLDGLLEIGRLGPSVSAKARELRDRLKAVREAPLFPSNEELAA